MQICLVYMTTGSRDEAESIGRELVLSGMAACVNVIDNMQSIYFWDGELQNDKEVVLIAKTTEDVVPDLINKVKTLHSYDCPCILSLPVAGGNMEFMGWIADQVKQNAKLR